MKNIRNFYLKIFIFLVRKFSVYLNRHVFVLLSVPHISFIGASEKAMLYDCCILFFIYLFIYLLFFFFFNCKV